MSHTPSMTCCVFLKLRLYPRLVFMGQHRGIIVLFSGVSGTYVASSKQLGVLVALPVAPMGLSKSREGEDIRK